MFRYFKIAFFILGLAAFSYLVARFGVDQIIANIRTAGWSLASVILVWLGIYLLNTSAWRLVLGAHAQAVSFRQLFLVTVSGFVINYITPIIALGGEPYKVKALTDTMGSRESLSAVVLYRMVHLLGHMLVLETGIAAAILFLDLPAGVKLTLAAAGMLILAIIAMTLSGHRKGVFQRIKDFFMRFRILERPSALLSGYENNLRAMDEIVTDAYNHQRRKFYFAICLEYLSRLLMGLEIYLILAGVGIQTTLVSALFLFVSYSIIINALFFVPFNLGAREGGLVLGLGSLALPPLLGVYLGVVMRIREFFWILLGLLFILLTSDKGKHAEEVRAL
jgi:uncharacterized protein (TIRG00374 family)